MKHLRLIYVAPQNTASRLTFSKTLKSLPIPEKHPAYDRIQEGFQSNFPKFIKRYRQFIALQRQKPLVNLYRTPRD